MIKHSTSRKFAVASAITLAFISSQAQSADGSLFVSGQITANTCKLVITDQTGVNKVNAIELGNVSQTLAPANTANAVFGDRKLVLLQLTNPAGTQACSGTGQWNAILDLQSDQVGTAGSNSFLKNVATTNAAGNVGLALFGGLNSSVTRISTILTDQSYLGTKVSPTNTPVSGGNLVHLGVQFVTTSTSAPTPGVFGATVPFLIFYQ